MAVVSVKTQLTQTQTVQIKTGLVWIVNDGTGANHLSNEAGAVGAYHSHLGRALDSAGSRAAAREAKLAINTRGVDNPGP